MEKEWNMKDFLKKAAIACSYFLTGALCGLLLNALILHSPLPELFPAYSDSFRGKIFSVDLISGIFLFCLLSPIIEELLFRRLVYDLLYGFIGFMAAAVISSLIFAAYHMNICSNIHPYRRQPRSMAYG